jgi:hypothetical protein
LVALDLVSTQEVPHLVVPGRHSHLPAMQASVEPQVTPQSPQLLKSFWMSRQVPAQTFEPVVGQVQVPPTHAAVAAGQVLPHVPQLRGSLVVSVQAPPHIVPVAQVHTPETHAWRLLQVRAHDPHAAGSALRSRQVPPQLTIVPGHAPSTAGTASMGAGVSEAVAVSVVTVLSSTGLVSEPVAPVSAAADESTLFVSAGASSEPPHAVSAADSRQTRTPRFVMRPPGKDLPDGAAAVQ